jgi:hypothetical protein
VPTTVKPVCRGERIALELGTDGAFELNDWSFSQVCKLAEVGKDTVNKLSAETALKVLEETLPAGRRPGLYLTEGDTLRAVHGTSYTRLWNAEVLSVVKETAVDFSPPPKGFNGATGLYCGEQDFFAFLIDPNGWAEVGGQAFAPGFFVWNSEVGKRTLGVQTFWFQQVCQNHIVWDAAEVVETSWRHTSKIQDALPELQRTLGHLVAQRDARRDGFVRLLGKAMAEKLGDDAEEVIKALKSRGIPPGLGKRACDLVHKRGERFTIWSLVDALTAMNREITYAGERTDADIRASALLALAA